MQGRLRLRQRQLQLEQHLRRHAVHGRHAGRRRDRQRLRRRHLPRPAPHGLGSCPDGSRDCMPHVLQRLDKICVANQCHDGSADGSESDVDCGGADLRASAPTGGKCNSGGDCTSSAATRTHSSASTRSARTASRTTARPTSTAAAARHRCAACGARQGLRRHQRQLLEQLVQLRQRVCVHRPAPTAASTAPRPTSTAAARTCSACGAGKICKLNSDCGSSGLRLRPRRRTSLHHRPCLDHHKDGNETDQDCGGGTCTPCALGKRLRAGQRLQSNYCDPSAHTCACGGVGQACCTGGTCTAAGDLCTGAVSVLGEQRLHAASSVTCPAAPRVPDGRHLQSGDGHLQRADERDRSLRPQRRPIICVVANSSTLQQRHSAPAARTSPPRCSRQRRPDLQQQRVVADAALRERLHQRRVQRAARQR